MLAKLLEILADALAKTKLYEMAHSRDDAKKLVTGLSVPIFEHLIKLTVFNLPETREHWIEELNGWFYQIDDIRLKPTNKRLDANTIYTWLVYDSSPHYTAEWIPDRVEKMIARQHSNVKVNRYDANIVFDSILNILSKASYDISRSKFKNIKGCLS